MSRVMAERHNNIRRLRESRKKEGRLADFAREMDEMFSDRSISLESFSIKRLAEALIDDGREFVETYYSNPSGGFRMQEAADIVNTSMFPNIIGQYVYNAVLRAYDKPELIGDRLVTKQSTMFNGEKIPGISPIGDQVEVVGEGAPYPTAVFGENWIETPATIKRGLRVDVSKEAVFFDRTNLILARANEVGEMVALSREKRILDVVFGIVTIYRRNGGAAEATYQSDNTLASTPLVDWSSLDAIDTKISQMTDPDTGEPIVITPNTMIVPPALRNVAQRIRRATMTGQTTSTRETRVQDVPGSNSLNFDWEPIWSQYVRARSGSDTTWFYGDPRAAFVYMENWPLTVEQQGTSSDASFYRDIVASYKASERGAAGVYDRRKMFKVTA